MSKQREAIPDIVKIVSDCDVDIGLILGGSVGRGCEREHSDLDFFAIAEAAKYPSLPGFTIGSEKKGARVLENNERGFPVHVAMWTTETLDDTLTRLPHMTYPLLAGEVVYDPAGTAERYLGYIRKYFDSRPRIKQAWERQLNDLRDFKAGKLEHAGFPQWSDFIRYIEKTFPEELQPDTTWRSRKQ